MIITPQKVQDYLHELLSIQHFIQHAEKVHIVSKVLEDVHQIPFVFENKEEITEDEEEEIITEIVNYNHNLAAKIPRHLAGNDSGELERLCKYRVSRKLIKTEILSQKNGFFSKVDKWIFVHNDNLNIYDSKDEKNFNSIPYDGDFRYESTCRTILTISTNFHYNFDDNLIDIRTAISMNTLENYSLPDLQKLLSSLSF